MLRRSSSERETVEAWDSPPAVMAAIGLSSMRLDTPADALTSSSPSFWMSLTLVANSTPWTSSEVIADR